MGVKSAQGEGEGSWRCVKSAWGGAGACLPQASCGVVGTGLLLAPFHSFHSSRSSRSCLACCKEGLSWCCKGDVSVDGGREAVVLVGREQGAREGV